MTNQQKRALERASLSDLPAGHRLHQPTPSQPERVMPLTEALWNLRVASKQWLLEHPDHPEAPAIRKALERTKDLV